VHASVRNSLVNPSVQTGIGYRYKETSTHSRLAAWWYIYTACFDEVILGIPLPLGLCQDMLYQLDNITGRSTISNIHHSQKTGHRLCSWAGQHPSMTAYPILSRRCIQLSHNNIVGRVELTVLRSGRCCKRQPAVHSLLFQAAIWKNNAPHHHHYHHAVDLQAIAESQGR
jgi:hypothetical protein